MKLILSAGGSADAKEFAEMLRLELEYYFRDAFKNEVSGTALYVIDLDENDTADGYLKRSGRGGAILYTRNRERIALISLGERQRVLRRPFAISELVEKAGELIDILTAAENVMNTERSRAVDIGISETEKFGLVEAASITQETSDRGGAENAGNSLFFDEDGCTVYFCGEKVELTNREYELLNYLYKNRGRTVTRSEAVNEVWRYDFTGNTNIVEVYIRYLRKKLDEHFDIKLIRTVRNHGYIIK